MDVDVRPGVADLLWRLGEDCLTVEVTLDFEHDVQKQVVAFPGASDRALGFECLRIDGLHIWWRQRLVLATREPRVTAAIRPRRLVVGRVGRALTAEVHYA